MTVRQLRTAAVCTGGTVQVPRYQRGVLMVLVAASCSRPLPATSACCLLIGCSRSICTACPVMATTGLGALPRTLD